MLFFEHIISILAITTMNYFLVIIALHLGSVSATHQPLKCCPLNQTYDVIEKVCQEHTNDHNVYTFDATTTKVVSPQCDDSQVLVEYDSGSYNITLRNDTLWLPSLSKPDTMMSLPGSAFCVDNVMDVDSDQPRWFAKTCQPRNICEFIPCVRKCCVDGETLLSVNNDLTCTKNQQGLPLRFHNISDGVALRVDVPAFGVLHYQRCALFQASRYQYVDFHPKFSSETGHLHQFFLTEEYGHDDYCVDFVKSDDRTFQKLQSFICHDNVEFRGEQFVFIICVSISAFLIGLTLLVYMLIPSIHTMSDRAHIRFVGCLFVSYLLELWRTLLVDTHYTVCVVVASIIYVTTICVYTWLTVVFFEIYRFYSIKFTGSCMKNKFIAYSNFAWGLPVLLLIINITLDGFDTGSSNIFTPNKSYTNCWFYNLESDSVFYFAPVAILLLIIIVLCVMIEINVRRLTKAANQQITNTNADTSGRRHKKYRSKTILHIELISSMLIVWIMGFFAILFFGVDHSIVEFVDAVPGIIVFVVFVLNKKTLLAIKHRWRNGPNADEQESVSESDGGITMARNEAERT